MCPFQRRPLTKAPGPAPDLRPPSPSHTIGGDGGKARTMATQEGGRSGAKKTFESIQEHATIFHVLLFCEVLGRESPCRGCLGSRCESGAAHRPWKSAVRGVDLRFPNPGLQHTVPGDLAPMQIPIQQVRRGPGILHSYPALRSAKAAERGATGWLGSRAAPASKGLPTMQAQGAGSANYFKRSCKEAFGSEIVFSRGKATSAQKVPPANQGERPPQKSTQLCAQTRIPAAFSAPAARAVSQIPPLLLLIGYGGLKSYAETSQWE
ncbi:PREDICTED: uncharacterized protein LOC102760349 [Myotis davidii]|uniref:uncharacterized protein LOC102760349 n=1 Tax=Myotis davidii TaxID=225400 RepID=UPI000766E39B|nr:PREDICTED: uncharacterized protein LOC102760349 [Myotis davidii]